ncbi:MAG: PAS domain S-box protein, partial [Hydrococcus sp. RU_2_2]|nr:PAS domain S-box protein [Hydrococcus sp. RU_2_2]
GDKEDKEIGETIQNPKSFNPKQEQLQEAIQRAAQGEFVRYEVEIWGAEDEIATIDFSLKPVRDEKGNVVLLIPEGRDISERKQLEDRLSRREREMCTMVHNLPDIIFRLDRQLRHTYVSPRVQQVSGIAAEEFIGKTGRELGLPVEACDRFEEKCREALATGQMTQIEYRIGDRYYSSRLIPEYGTEGEIESLLGITEDISERKQAEQELGEANERLLANWESMTDAYVFLDSEWRITYTNQAATRAFYQVANLEPEGFLGRSHWEVFPWSVGQITEQQYRRAMTEQVAVHFELFYEPTGDWFEVHAYPSSEGLGIYFRDISDRKLAEIALRDSERRYASLAKLSPVGILRSDRHGHITYVSDRCSEITGFSPEESFGLGIMSAIHPDDRDRVWQEWLRSVEAQQSFYAEYRFLHADGTIRWVIEQTMAETDENDRIVGYITAITDISDRKRAEAALQESEERFRSTFDSAAVGIAHVGTDGQWLLVNQTLCDIVGYTCEELQGKTFQDITHPEDLEKDLAYVRQMLANEIEIYSMEKRYIHKNGSLVWINLTVSLLREPNGEPKYFISVVQNIDDRKRLEEALRQSSAEIYELYNNAPCGYHSLDGEGNFVLVNETELQMLGYTRNELIGKKFSDLLAPESIQKFEESFPQFKQRGWVQDLEFEIIRKDNTILTVSLSATAIKDKEGNYLSSRSTIMDISERKRAEQALRESERRYETLARLAPVGIYRCDRDGNVTYVNDRGCEITGLSRLESFGLDGARALHPDDRDRVMEQWLEAVENQQPFYSEHRLVHPDGRIRWVIGQASPETDENGRVIGYIATLTDITDRKRAEIALQDSDRRVATIARLSPVGLFRSDRYASCFYANERCSELLGLPHEEILGMGWMRALHPEDRDRVMREANRALAQNLPFYSECRFQHPDGKVVWVIGQALPEIDSNGRAIGYIGTITDISDRKITEEQLRESEHKLQSAIEVAQISPYEWNPATGELIWDARLKAIWGLAADAEVNYDVFAAGLHPEDREYVEQQVAKSVDPNGDGIYKAEFRVIGIGDKIERWVSARGQTIFDNERRPVHFVGAAQDISERKRAEEALKASEARFRRIFECNMAPMGIWEREGGIINANDALLNTVGYSRQELEAGNIDWLALTPPEYHDLDNRALAETDARGFCTPFEKEYIRKDGRRIPILIGGAGFSDDPDSGIFFAIDLSDRKRAEEALRESEARLKQLVELNLLGVMFWDVDGSVLDANDAFLNIIGYSREDLQAGRLNWRRLTPPEQLESSDRSLDTMRDRNSSTLEKEYIRSDGKRIPVLLGGVMFKGSQNRGVSFVVDLSDRKQMENELRESQQRYESLARLSPVGIFRGDRNGINCFYANERACEIAGISPEEVIGTHWIDALHPDDRDRVTQLWQQAIAENIPFYAEYRFLHKDGTVRWVIGQAMAETDSNGRVIGYIGTVTDISDRKRTEEALRESQQRFQLAVEGADMATWDADMRTGKTIWCAKHFRILGYEPVASGEATIEMWQSRVHPDDLEQVMQAMERAKQERSLYSPEHRIIRVDNGEIRWLRVFGRFIDDETGEAVRFIGIFFDNTERKQLEAELQESEQRYRYIFDTGGVSVWQEDFTEVNAAIDRLKAQGIEDFRQYFAEHPEFVQWAIENIRLLNVNDVTVRMCEAESKEQVLASLSQICVSETIEVIIEELLTIAAGETFCSGETVIQTLKGKRLNILFTLTFPPPNEPYDCVIVTLLDISDRKQAELMLLEQKRLLELTASGTPLDECLSALCTSVSNLSPRTRACLLLPDDRRLKFTRFITPDLPPSFAQGLQDAPINDLAIGTCGEAVYCGEPVICADIANDGRWSQGWRDLCVAHGILACYSVPVMGIDNQCFGSLMLCFDEARLPPIGNTDWQTSASKLPASRSSAIARFKPCAEVKNDCNWRYKVQIKEPGIGISKQGF